MIYLSVYEYKSFSYFSAWSFTIHYSPFTNVGFAHYR